MNVKKMDIAEIGNIYDAHMVIDFPKDELKSMDILSKLYAENCYFGYGFFEGEELLAYAMFVRLEGSTQVLLDYFAVCRGGRGKGTGTKFLQLLMQQMEDTDNIIIEVEDPSAVKDKDTWALRLSRIAFYKRLGAVETFVRTKAFGVRYRILCLSIKRFIGDKRCGEELTNIYRRMFPRDIFEHEFERLEDAQNG